MGGPYDKLEADNAAKASLSRWSKVNKMEADLAALTKSSMAYRSCYAKSASQMAAEALSADSAICASSTKKTKKTIVEPSIKRTADWVHNQEDRDSSPSSRLPRLEYIIKR